MTKEEGKQQIRDLVRKFEQMPDYRLKTCNEEQTKKNFILPLFEALGWDVRSDEVRAEETVSGGRVDYAFKIGDITKFYLEAKPAKADLEKDRYEEQLIDYAYNRDVTWGVLTNFRELRIFNALEKTPRPIAFTFKDYLKDFDLLWLISKESFEIGEINKWAERLGIKSVPVPPVGKQLADDLTGWRDELTKRIRSWEAKLTQEEIDEAVQKFLDRLIFIRVAEDRGLEERVLLPLYNKHKGEASLITELNKLFREFDKKYDSTLFHKHFSEDLELGGVVDNIGRIIKGMHVTKDDKRYDFSLIDADILGAVYEQYLGTIQRKGTGTQRKEQGIYYTPKFIVNYIVENTLGKLLYEENLPVREVKELKILDPACGSGSFLIKAFEVLDEFYGKAKAPESERRKHILTKNLYGVDLDPKAIEVAQLNLMLSAAKKRELLPELHENLRVGNSLISGEEKELRRYFGEEWEEKKPFDWKRNFIDIFKSGRFDVVLGNPPYLFGEYLPKNEKRYFAGSFEVAKKQFDTYWLFLEQGLRLLKQGGLMGWIIPDALLARQEPEVLRRLLLEKTQLLNLIHAGPVFSGTGVSAVVLICRKERGEGENFVKVGKFDEGGNLAECSDILQSTFSSQPNAEFTIFIDGHWGAVQEKIEATSSPLKGLVTISRGEELGKSSLQKKSGEGRIPILSGADINKYQVGRPRYYVDKSLIRKDPSLYEAPKIAVVKTGSGLVCALEEEGLFTLQSLYNLRIKERPIDHNFLLGVLNSNLLSQYVRKRYTGYKELFPQLTQGQILSLPIPKLVEPEKQKHAEKLASLVCQMIKCKKSLTAAKDGSRQQRDLIQEIDKITKKINQLVYKLYNLTPEEIKIVEEVS